MNEKRERTRAAVGALALVLLGVAVGIALDRTLLAPEASPELRPGDHEPVVLSLTDDLGLDPDQADRVREIFQRHQATVDETWAGTHRALMAALDSVTQQIEAVLDPSQVARYHAWIDQRHPPGDPRRPNHLPPH